MKKISVGRGLAFLAVILAGAAWAYSASAAGTGDGKVLGIITAIDQNEVAAADLAVKKDVPPDVLEFAQMMRKEHNANMDAAEALALKITTALPEASAVSVELRAKGEKDRVLLMAKSGAAFNAAYIAAMVQGHQEVLDTIDNKLLKDAVSPEVTKFLQDTREHVVMHLKSAEKIQAHLTA